MMRRREKAGWDLEERHIQDRHQLNKEQIKDTFNLQKQEMLVRHGKEKEQLSRMWARRIEAVIRQQQVEKRALPKRIRSERKARELMFRESLRIGSPLPSRLSQAAVEDGDQRSRLKTFLEQERKRYKAEEQRFEVKHNKKLEEIRAKADVALKELEQLQNEKRRMLTDHETAKRKSEEETYQTELRQWRAAIEPRQQKMEEDFMRELEEQEKYYAESGEVDWQ